MLDLVRYAVYLSDFAGGSRQAVDLAVQLSRWGASAFGISKLDTKVHLQREGERLGILDGKGKPNAVRAAELILVSSLIAELPDASPRPPTAPRLVFTAPREAGNLIRPKDQFVLAVEDVIRTATTSLRIGGPFWNQEGLDRLMQVIGPAVLERGVRCDFYVHRWSDSEDRALIEAHTRSLGSNAARLWWYQGPAASLMHAKFVVADSSRGLIGSANLSSLGFEHHIEVGIPIEGTQCLQLEAFLESLVEIGLLATSPSISKRSAAT